MLILYKHRMRWHGYNTIIHQILLCKLLLEVGILKEHPFLAFHVSTINHSNSTHNCVTKMWSYHMPLTKHCSIWNQSFTNKRKLFLTSVGKKCFQWAQGLQSFAMFYCHSLNHCTFSAMPKYIACGLKHSWQISKRSLYQFKLQCNVAGSIKLSLNKQSWLSNMSICHLKFGSEVLPWWTHTYIRH